MKIETAHLICYSPTGTTFTSLKNIAEGMGVTPHILDLTLPDKTPDDGLAIFSDVVLIGVPVYAGRVAPVAARRLLAIHGNNTPAVVVVTYGNRHYEGALVELADLARNAGFMVVAGATVIGEHSYSSSEKPIAEGRPDGKDKEAATRFGAAVMEKLNQTALSDLSAPELPGKRPEGPYMGPAGIAPEIEGDLCTLCGQCAEICPTGAIRITEAVTTDASLCTFCCACLKACPAGAIRITIPKVLEKVNLLYENCQTRREPEFFL